MVNIVSLLIGPRVLPIIAVAVFVVPGPFWLFAELSNRAYHVRRLREVPICISSLGRRTHGNSEKMVMG